MDGPKLQFHFGKLAVQPSLCVSRVKLRSALAAARPPLSACLHACLHQPGILTICDKCTHLTREFFQREDKGKRLICKQKETGLETGTLLGCQPQYRY